MTDPTALQLAPSTWSPRLAMDLALGIDGESAVAERYGMSIDDLNGLLCTPAFAAQVASFRKDLHESGEIFRAKAKVQAEELLDTSYQMIQSRDTPANVRADLIKSTVEWAGLKPSGKGVQESAPAFSITFNFPQPSGQPAPPLPKGPRPTITVDNV